MDKEILRKRRVTKILLSLCLAALCMPGWPVYPQDNTQSNLQVAPPAQIVKPIARKIEALENSQSEFEPVELFSREISLASHVEGGTLLDLDLKAVRKLLGKKPNNIALLLPTADQGTVELKLYRADVSTADFSVVTSSGEVYTPSEAVHYRGIVDGQPDSLVAISVLPRDAGFEVMGFYSTPALGNVVLGGLKGKKLKNRHILYADKRLQSKPSFTCDTNNEDAGDGRDLYTPSQLFAYESAASTQATFFHRSVRIYVEVDWDVFQDRGSVPNVVTFVTGFFNQVATLYSNESIPIELSQLFIWNTGSPYVPFNTRGELLSEFQQVRTSFNGDLGGLIAFRSGGGRAAGFNGLCNSNSTQSQFFTQVLPTFNNVPTFSSTVNIFAHEMGHLMGSRHTHACVWNGNNTAIDGCVTPEGVCGSPGEPSGGGTIMSYCHLTSVGVNFSLGFGIQPGSVIRSNFNAANCLTASDPAAVSWGNNRIDVFTRGAENALVRNVDNALWHRWWDGSAWSNWESLGGKLTSAPAVCSWGNNRLDVFVRGTDNALWHKWWDGSAWSNWESLGGVLTSAPAAVSWGPDRIDVFAKGSDNALWHKAWNGSPWRKNRSGWLGWSNWEPLGGSIASAPAACSWGNNRLDVFARGTNNDLVHIWWGGSGWSVWESLGGTLISAQAPGVLTSAPAAVSWGPDRIDVFVRGAGNGLYHIWYDNMWHPWENVGQSAILTSGPAVSSWAPGRLDIFAYRTDKELWHLRYENGWFPWDLP